MAQYESAYTGAEIDSAIGKANNAIAQTINKTWSELKTMRDGGTLIPGQWYRITDYTTTTNQGHTQSAGNLFDIIVRAYNTTKLNENAFAAQHSGTNYFNGSNLGAWELKYCLDNDTTRFVWANTNGKGVIYYMKDEFGNEAPYDFKNIKFSRRYIDYVSTDSYVPSYFNNKFCAYYDSPSASTLSPSGVTVTTECYMYTFTKLSSTGRTPEITDHSLTKYCHDNKINAYFLENKICLNNIVFFATVATYNIYNNNFEAGSNSLTFFGSCYRNNFFGQNQRSLFGENFHDNVIKGDFTTNNFSSNCYCNLIGHSFSNNYVNDSFKNNQIGNDCFTNKFGSNFILNKLFNVRNSVFKSNCKQNNFNNCEYLLINEDCSNNTLQFFGNSDSYNSLYVPTSVSYANLINCYCTYTESDDLDFEVIMYLLSPFDVTINYRLGITNDDEEGGFTESSVTLTANVREKLSFSLTPDSTDGLTFYWRFNYPAPNEVSGSKIAYDAYYEY